MRSRDPELAEANAALPRTAPLHCLTARIAATPADRRAALALRATVFAGELGAGDDADRYDTHAVHLIVEDPARGPDRRVVGTARLMGTPEAVAAGGFYTAREFDIGCLTAIGAPLVEVGRTCLHPDYRGGTAMVVLWRALARIAADRGAAFLFGTASFPGTDIAAHRAALDILYRRHLAPEPLRVRSRQGGWTPGPVPIAQAGENLAAMRATPALLKSYLRLGGVIGDGVFVDRDFNCTDVCLILPTNRLTSAAARLYGAAP